MPRLIIITYPVAILVPWPNCEIHPTLVLGFLRDAANFSRFKMILGPTKRVSSATN